LNDSLRLLGLTIGIGVAAALVLGVALGLAQEENVLRWIAYMLSVAGAITIAFACFSGAPTSARKHFARMRKQADEPEAAAVVESKPYASALVVLLVAGLLLIAAGTGLELLL
jgi:glucan phosphoethanolaminetransferase (alkaline phosphatase superfamily)